MSSLPASGTASASHSSRFRILLLKLMAVTAGLVVGVGALACAAYWTLTRPKPWNTSAITAKFKKLAIYENRDKPSEPHYYLNVYFDASNTTGSDYVLPTDAWQNHLMETQSGSLLGSAGWTLSLSQATLPSRIPSGFFDPKPISIPAHATVEILASYDSTYIADAVKGKTKEQVIDDEFHHTDELVVLDESRRYRISFPVKGIWRAQASRASAH